MKLFVPFLIAGTILLGLLYAQMLRPSLLQQAQDMMRNSIPPLSQGLKPKASLASTSELGAGKSSEEWSHEPQADAVRHRSSHARELRESIALDHEARGLPALSEMRSEGDRSLQP